MSKEPNNIDRLVREKLDGFEMPPPPSVWNATEAAIVQSSGKKRFFLWFFLGLSFIAFLSVGLYYFTKVDSQETQLVEEKFSKEKTELISKNLETMKDKSDSENNISSGELKNNLAGNDQQEIDKNNAFQSQVVTNVSVKLNLEKQNSSRISRLGLDKSNQSKVSIQANSSTSNTSKAVRSPERKSILDLNSDVAKGNQQVDNINDLDKSNQPLNENGQLKLSIASNSNSNKSTRSSGTKSVFDSNSDVTKENQQVNNINDLATGNQFDSLPTTPVQLFTTKGKEPISIQPDENHQLKRSPFWKSFSIEGSIGMSTFKNHPSNAVDASFLNYLTQNASNQLSFDLRFGLNYHFTHHLSVQSGIHYNSSREDYGFDGLETTTYTYMDTISFTVDSVTMDTTYIINPILSDSTISVAKIGQNSYKIFTLPFQFAWSQTISKRGILEFAMGGSISLYGRNSGSVVVDNSKFAIAAENAYRTSGVLSLGGSIKYLHRFGDHHSVYIEPWAQFGLTNQSGPALNYESLRRRYGIRVGYRFYF